MPKKRVIPQANIEACRQLVSTYLALTGKDILDEMDQKVGEWFANNNGTCAPAILHDGIYREVYDKTKGRMTYDTMNYLTGFGDKSTCLLCQSVDNECTRCIHSYARRKDEGKAEVNYCAEGNSSFIRDSYPYSFEEREAIETYGNLESAETPHELFIAIRLRAAYLLRLLMHHEKITGK